MATITVRDVPGGVRDMLVAQATQRGLSLQKYLREVLIDLASKPDVVELLHEIRAVKASDQPMLPADDILALRDDGRR